MIRMTGRALQDVNIAPATPIGRAAVMPKTTNQTRSNPF